MAHVGYLAIKRDWVDVNGKALQIAAQKLGMTLYLVEHNLTDSAEAFRSLENAPPDALIVAQGQAAGHS